MSATREPRLPNPDPPAAGVRSRIEALRSGQVCVLVAAGVLVIGLAGWVLFLNVNSKPVPLPHGVTGWAALSLILLIPGALLLLAWVRLGADRTGRGAPAQISRFRDSLEALRWDAGSREVSIRALGIALVDLALAEVDYYYGRRRRTRWVSGVLRFMAWLFGTAGILTPLVDTAIAGGSSVSPWGYVLLGIAAAMLAANTLFEGTLGHVRSTRAQLALEQLIVEFSLKWNVLLAEHAGFGIRDADPDQTLHPGVQALFAEALTFARGFAHVINDETGTWAVSVVAALQEIRATLGVKQPTGMPQGSAGGESASQQRAAAP
jgi:hypothetical protein